MTITQIYSAIGERVDDPDKLQYSNRYLNVFISAMTELLKLRDDNGRYIFAPEEYPSLRTQHNFEATFSGKWYKKDFTDISNLSYILDIFTDPDETSNVTYNPIQKEYSELVRIKSNQYLEPSGDEIYWAKKGNAVFMLSSLQSGARFSADVILNPNPDNWGTNDLISDLGYGRGFIEACITRAAQILRKEIGLE